MITKWCRQGIEDKRYLYIFNAICVTQYQPVICYYAKVLELLILTKLVVMYSITDYSRMRATLMATDLFLTVCIRVSWQLYVDVKKSLKSSTAPQMIRKRKSQFSALLEQITAARQMDLSVGGSAMLQSRKF